MEPFAIADDVAGSWRAPSDEETAAASNLVEAASRIIRRRFPDIDARISAGKIDADLVGDVAVQMVLRVLRNPDGARSVSETIGDSTVMVSFDDELVAAGLHLTDAEEALLRKRRGTAFSVRTPGEPETLQISEQVALHRRRRDGLL